MYTAGIPVGLLVDNKGPRPGVLLGSVLLGVGYFFQYRAYNGGPGSMGIPWLCLFASMTGIGGCAAFAGSIKTSALNWPNHRGTATAFPLAGFGLSAFFFSLISSLAFPDNTSDLLLLLSILTFAMCFVGGFFLQVVPQSHVYASIPHIGERNESDTSTQLKRTKSGESRNSAGRLSHEAGTQPGAPSNGSEETSSLLSKSSGSGPGDVPCPDEEAKKAAHDSPRLDIRGFALLRHVKFWQLWLLLGLLTGIGLMTIKQVLLVCSVVCLADSLTSNIGNDARAIWRHYDDSAPAEFIQQRQLIHVEILSIMSFCGRLMSVRRLSMSRFWCLVISSFIFLFAQIAATQIENPHTLGYVSGLTGLAYGFLFGCYPALVAETFGVHGLSQNWGCMTLAPVISGNIFNLLYGHIYDRHSVILKDGTRDCREGLYCYRNAYFVTLGASLAGLGLALWSVRWDWVGRRVRGRVKDVEWEA
ncbi:MAG: hypothetical protein Q9217_000497 [Psora testacea]